MSLWIRIYLPRQLTFFNNDSQRNKAGKDKLDFHFFLSLLYGTPANSTESQLLEAWPASHYGHLIRESADLGVAANSHFYILGLSGVYIDVIIWIS